MRSLQEKRVKVVLMKRDSMKKEQETPAVEYSG